MKNTRKQIWEGAVKGTIRTLSDTNPEISCSLGWENTRELCSCREVLIQQM